MVAEENVVGVADHDVVASARNFLCPKCNKIFQSMGHHSTFSVKTLKTKFPKGKLRQFRAALPPAERKTFKDTFDGKRIPKDGEIKRWLAVLSELP
jgi:hypothetical protein